MEETLPIHLSETQFEIKETNLADSHAPASAMRKQLERGAVDLGDGFLMHDEPVVVDRGPDGSIIRVTPVGQHPVFRVRDEEEALPVAERPSPVKLPRKQREQLVAILATRMFKYFEQQGDRLPYNPLLDGISDLPSGSPEYLQPLPSTHLYPATRGQVYDWLKGFVAARVQVMEKPSKGFGHNVTDYTLRFSSE